MFRPMAAASSYFMTGIVLENHALLGWVYLPHLFLLPKDYFTARVKKRFLTMMFRDKISGTRQKQMRVFNKKIWIFIFPLCVLLASRHAQAVNSTDASDTKNTYTTQNDLETQCKSIQGLWQGPTDIQGALTWMESVMAEKGAQYAYQEPIRKSMVNYYFVYDGSPAINNQNLTRLIVTTFRNLNPYIPDPLDTYPQYLQEIKFMHEKYGGSTVIYPELVSDKIIIASRGIDSSHFSAYWQNEELNEPPSYVEGILNEYEKARGKESRWVFKRSEWRDSFIYIYSRFLKTAEPQGVDLYINYSFDFSARRDRRGQLEDVKLRDLRCAYGRYDEVESAAKGMPPATEPTAPLPP